MAGFKEFKPTPHNSVRIYLRTLVTNYVADAFNNFTNILINILFRKKGARKVISRTKTLAWRSLFDP